MDRRERAVVSHRGTTTEIILRAQLAEEFLARELRGRTTPREHAFDILVPDCEAALEVKTIQVSGKQSAHVTINRRAAELKRDYVGRNGYTPWILAIDLRGAVPRYYLRQGVGSFRLSTMPEFSTPRSIRLHLLKVSRERASVSAGPIPISYGLENYASG